MAEYIAAEIGAKHFPERARDAETVCIAGTLLLPGGARPGLAGDLEPGTFDSYTPRLVTLGGVLRTKLGMPRWKYLPTPQVARLIGEAEMRAGRGREMSCVKPHVLPPITDRAAWQRRREARRRVLDKVRARRARISTGDSHDRSAGKRLT